ncbi:efflux RND transporter permease subunit [Pseudoalteromonas sp. NEC-BIFX-2020_002]|uniref:efflux RND transporter permease subunit n=1 Tax=Pseudoalteromonas sp. NEC-BIFX-2020_002 TaxID=2732353 RepID=UPI001476E04B|nr:efflux RND transporter permease subunit [Pseudoalteromonas sp. NEC-BIFX-2020_002]NNG43220.1 efflux RND transporter permease subunit [Pseudoalteromonas sp. NEC-BIFX-2020_002]
MTTQHTPAAPYKNSVIAFFCHRPLIANLLMLFIIAMGLLSFNSIQRQMFPIAKNPEIHIQIQYFGASAKELEEQVVAKIEHALNGQAGIKRVQSQARQHSASMTIALYADQSSEQRLNEIKHKLDAIADLPKAMEPIILQNKPQLQNAVSLVLTGPDDKLALKQFGEHIKRELLARDLISHVQATNLPDVEFSIEVTRYQLQRYGLSLQDIADLISQHSKNISAGQIATKNGKINLQMPARKETIASLNSLPILNTEHGELLTLGNIATIKKSLTEQLHLAKLNGKNAFYMRILADESQSITAVAQSVQSYLAYKTPLLPAGFSLYQLVDTTYYLEGRLNMMLNNLAQGALLVFIVLSLFLRVRLAMWVMLGLPVSFLGAIWLMPFIGVTLNVVSLFAFIMVLGIVVDDAIVISESAANETTDYGHNVENIITGASKVVAPATFGVLTTMAVFMPFMFSTGPNSGQFIAIAGVALLCLFFSLIESKMILPAHLAHSPIKPLSKTHWRTKFDHAFNQWLADTFVPVLKHIIHFRYPVLMLFIAFLVGAILLVKTGLIGFTAVPKVPHDFPSIHIQMDNNASHQQTLHAVKSIEQMVLQVEQQTQQISGRSLVKDTYIWLDNDTEGEVLAPLVDEDKRPFDAFELARHWQAAMPTLLGVKAITIESDVIDINQKPELSYQLYSDNLSMLTAATLDLSTALSEHEAITQLTSNLNTNQQEWKIQLTPKGRHLGLTSNQVAKQVFAYFYGIEVQRVVTQQQTVRFMVRGDLNERQSFSSLNNLPISVNEHSQVFFSEIATLTTTQSSHEIHTEQGRRTFNVSAFIVPSKKPQTKAIHLAIETQILPAIKARYPDVSFDLGEHLKEQQQEQSQVTSFAIIALLMVYSLLAIPLKSYSQPFLIIFVIPFATAGALYGHLLLGYTLSMMSIFGIVAASGVVINDALVLLTRVNQLRNKMPLNEAIYQGAAARFKAILITSLTTFIGLLPLMFESSLQAQFVIPMAVSLSFAVLFATLTSLILLPCLLYIANELKTIPQQGAKAIKLQLLKAF